MMQSNKSEEQKAFEPLRIAAEQILSINLGDRIQIDEIERLSEHGRRNLLLRCIVHPVNGLSSSFIIKKVEAEIYNPDDAESWDTRRFFNDWMGSQFLSTISSESKHSPHFYGGDRNLGFIILEDVQHRDRLVEPLLGNDRNRAEQALIQYATCLGKLHNDTIGKAAEFEQLFQTLAPKFKLTKPTTRPNTNIQQHELMLKNLGIQPGSNWFHEIESIDRAVNHPGEFLAYIHADACPDNVLDTGEELRLIDFETGYFGHALIDAVYGRMMFPSCLVCQPFTRFYNSANGGHLSADTYSKLSSRSRRSHL